MRTLTILLVCAAACGGKHKPTTGAGSQAIYPKTMRLSWGLKAAETGDKIDVFLQTTDETGGQQSFPVGTYGGPCKVIAPAAAMKAVSGVGCPGVELHAVIANSDVVVLKLDLSGGSAPDPMARVEITRVAAPPGAAIEKGS